MSSVPASETPRALSAWFLLCGFVTASWVAHIPRQTEALNASPGSLGLALLCMAVGSVLGMTAAPRLIGRFGSGAVAWASAIAFSLLIPLPLLAGSVVMLGVALLIFGIACGITDVSMNAAAAACEQAAGRPIMSAFHGWYSVGMVVGVSGGVALLASGFTPAGHAATVIAIAALLLAYGRPMPGVPLPAQGSSTGWRAGLSRHALALAILAFVSLFLEGAMADWAGLLAAQFGASPEIAPLAYVAFTITWAGGRFVGDRMTARLGDVAVVRVGGILASVGVTLALVIATPMGVAFGCLIVGLGLANAVPVLFRGAAAMDATGRGLVIVTGLGYTGFLVGPPMVGFTAEAVGLPRAMLLVVVGGILMAVSAAVLRPRKKTADAAPAENPASIRCRAILFDMDGTLVDTTQAIDGVWREWAARAGVDPEPILAIHHGRRPEETLRITYPSHATDEEARWVQTAAELRSEGVKAIDGAAALLDGLNGRPWAVVTSASRQLAEMRLRSVGLWRNALLIGADDVAEGKPSPEGYLAAAKKLGVRPEECVVMEDAPVGVEAARRAGMQVIGMATTHALGALNTTHQISDFSKVTVALESDGQVRLQLQCAGSGGI